jgi:hypothetical protein
VTIKFKDGEDTAAVLYSHGDFGLVVQFLDHAAGKLLFGLEIIQQ